MTASEKREDLIGYQAAYWLTALRDDPDNEELQQGYEAWCAASADHAAAAAETEETEAVFRLLASAGRASDASVHAVPPATRRGRRFAGYGLRFGAAAALAACLALFMLPGIALRLEADHMTSTGELLTVSLDDGSVVNLAPESAISLEFDGERRGVRLLQGKAFFNVRPDPARPFRVLSGETVTTVLGTSFGVQLKEGVSRVAVSEGKVSVVPAVADGSTKVTAHLEAGDWVSMGAAGRVAEGDVASHQVGIWRQGHIVARDTPVSELVDELRPYFGGGILILDDDLAARRVSGVYNTADPIAAIEAAAGVYEGRVRRPLPWLVLVSRD